MLACGGVLSGVRAESQERGPALSYCDDRRLKGEITVRREDGRLRIEDAVGDVMAVFYDVVGDYEGDIVWAAFVDGLIARAPSIDIWDESATNYLVCGGSPWLRSTNDFRRAESRSVAPR